MSKREQALYASLENERLLMHVWSAAAKSLYDYRRVFHTMPDSPACLNSLFAAFQREQSALQ